MCVCVLERARFPTLPKLEGNQKVVRCALLEEEDFQKKIPPPPPPPPFASSTVHTPEELRASHYAGASVTELSDVRVRPPLPDDDSYTYTTTR